LTQKHDFFLFIIKCLETLSVIISKHFKIAALFNQTLQNRLRFESQELQESFYKENKCASFAFEVSSEGELEQIKPLLIDLLKDNKLIELIYSSNSVEKNCKLLAGTYRNLRIRPIYLINKSSQFRLSKWVTSSVVIFCRYDFYPELLLLKKNRTFILLAGSLKNKDLNKKFNFYSYFLKNVYSLFDLIITVTDLEKRKFQNFFPNKEILTYDFRHKRIINRITKHKELTETLNNLKNCQNQNRIILGSYWESSFFLFDNELFKSFIEKERPLIFIAPHLLNESNLMKIKKSFDKFSPVIINNIEEFKNTSFSDGVFIINISGILCELYSYFNIAYIDGGFGRSIHSVLEPFWANCNIITGPKTHRSSEYDFIVEKDSDRVFKIVKPCEFTEILLKLKKNEHKNNVSRFSIGEDILKQYNSIYKRFIDFEVIK